jgi:predicted porin
LEEIIMHHKKRLALAVASLFALAAANPVYADETSDLKAKFETLQNQMETLKAQLDTVTSQMQQQKQVASSPGISMKPGNDLTFQVGGGEVTLYGHVDVSLDDQTSGLSGFIHNGQTVTGNNGWVPDVSSNLSFFGVRGARPIDKDLKAVFQFETEVAYAATPGTSDQSTDSGAQKFSLGSRNSFVGLQSAAYGAVKLGKTDTPYKTSTGRMDPFASTPGDYNAIMGNSGGDNRAEFDMRLPHSIWYESPKLSGFTFNGLVSPGQNRSTNNGLYALGEPDCSGGNTTNGVNGTNGVNPASCLDGSFANAYSAAVIYEAGPLYATGGYERHNNANRTGDEIDAGTIGIRNESAYKLGVQYAFPTKTTVNFIVEKLKRDAITPALDERSHTATWLAITQQLTAYDDLNFGWARAGKTPGQPIGGVEDKYGNDAPSGKSDNGANLYSIGYKHRFLDKRTTTYLTFSRLVNDYWAHYSLGAGGHGLPTRNYVGDKFIGGCQDGGVCGPPFSGNTAEALSVGLTYDF